MDAQKKELLKVAVARTAISGDLIKIVIVTTRGFSTALKMFIMYFTPMTMRKHHPASVHSHTLARQLHS